MIRTARLFARTIRGLEPHCVEEIQATQPCRIEQVRHREVVFTARNPTPDLLGLRTVDDLFAVAVLVEGIGRTKNSLSRLSAAVKHADLQGVSDDAHILTGTRPSRQIDVSASFVGRRNYSRFDVEDAVGNAVAQRLGATYHSRSGGDRPPPGTASWRVTIDAQTAVIGLRLGNRPLHRRDWKRRSVPGTLHPPVAATMANLADLRPGDRVLDPCCGAGTLLIEAAHVVPGLTLTGSDSSHQSLQAAAANAHGQVYVGWIISDAGSMPLADDSVDKILVNPPWRRQVDAQHQLRTGMGSMWTEASRVLRKRGLLVALLHDPGELEDIGVGGAWDVTERSTIRLFGAYAQIIVARPDRS